MDKIILAPGPTQCDQRFLDVLSKPVKYHRAHDFHEVYGKTRNILKKIVGLNKGEAILLTCSGTGAMEAAVANLFSESDKVLVVSIGHFGNRFAEICDTYLLNTDVLEYPIGSTYELDEIKDYLNDNPDCKGVFVTHHETSSGVLNDLAPIGELTNQLENCLFVVDSISGLMVHPMDMDKWHIDCVVAASQKGFLIPPGLATAFLSPKAIAALDKSNLPKYYNDFGKYLKMLDIEETPYTPNISLIFALYKACKYIYEDYGMDNYYKYYEDLRIYLSQKLAQRGLDIDVVAEKDRGSVLVMFNVKPGWNAKVIHDTLDDKGWIIATGFGENKTKMLRVGVIGNITKNDIDKFLECFDQTIKELYE